MMVLFPLPLGAEKIIIFPGITYNLLKKKKPFPTLQPLPSPPGGRLGWRAGNLLTVSRLPVCRVSQGERRQNAVCFAAFCRAIYRFLLNKPNEPDRPNTPSPYPTRHFRLSPLGRVGDGCQDWLGCVPNEPDEPNTPSLNPTRHFRLPPLGRVGMGVRIGWGVCPMSLMGQIRPR